MKKNPTLLILTLVILLAACGSKVDPPAASNPIPAAATFIAEGHLYPTRNLYLVFPARGRVEQILVSNGDQVSEGQVLVSLGDSQPAESALAAAELELTLVRQAYDTLIRTADLGHAQAWQTYIEAQKSRSAAQLAWDRLDLNAIQTDIDNAQADVTTRQTDLEDARKDLDKYIDLPTENATRKSYQERLRTAETNYDMAVQKLENITNRRDLVRIGLDAALNIEIESRRAYENTQDGPDTDQLILAEARLKWSQAQADAAQAALDNYTLKAPFSGMVMDINVEVGEWTGPESYAVALADVSEWYVDTSDLSELDVVNVRIGQTVEVAADALSDVLMTGMVESISCAPKVQGGDILYTVRIRMDDLDPSLRWGMTVEVRFFVQAE